MRDIMTVFAFTFRDNIKKKSFIITTVIVLLLIFIGCSLPSILGSKSSDTAHAGDVVNKEKSNTCFIIDEDNLIPGAIPALEAAYSDVRFTKGDLSKYDEYKATVEQDKSYAILEITKGDKMPSLKFTITDFMSGAPIDGMAEVIRHVIVTDALSKQGVSEDATQLALSDISYETVPAGKMDVTGYALGIVLTMIMFFSIYFYGYGVAMSVASEKTSRVMETLIVSAKPSRILLGKCLAMGVLGLLQLTIFIIAGALGYSLLVPSDFTISGVPLALSSFTLPSAILILVYFLLGYALFAMINSVCGATVSRAEDLNSAMMPSVIISLISFYSAYMVMFLPDSGIRRVVTYIPFTSPFIMPFRLLNETVAGMDIIISIILLIIAIILVAAISIKLYSASVLHYGQRLKIKDMFKLKA